MAQPIKNISSSGIELGELTYQDWTGESQYVIENESYNSYFCWENSYLSNILYKISLASQDWIEHPISDGNKNYTILLSKQIKPKVDLLERKIEFRALCWKQLEAMGIVDEENSLLNSGETLAISSIAAEYIFDSTDSTKKINTFQKDCPIYFVTGNRRNNVCVLETFKIFGTGGFKNVVEGLVFKVPSLDDPRIFSIERVALQVVFNKIPMARAENKMAKKFSSAHIIKPCSMSYTRKNHDGGFNWVMVNEILQGSLIEPEMLKLPLKTKLRILRGCAQGLSIMHAEGIIHRDVKMENYMVRETPSKKEPARMKQQGVLIDLGLSIPEEKAPANPVGSPYYLAPELIEKNQIRLVSQTKQGDLWSYAVVMYIFIMKQMPTYLPKADNLTNLIIGIDKVKHYSAIEFKKLLFGRKKYSDPVVIGIVDLILKLFSINPEDRGTALELHTTLKALHRQYRVKEEAKLKK